MAVMLGTSLGDPVVLPGSWWCPSCAAPRSRFAKSSDQLGLCWSGRRDSNPRHSAWEAEGRGAAGGDFGGQWGTGADILTERCGLERTRGDGLHGTKVQRGSWHHATSWSPAAHSNPAGAPPDRAGVGSGPGQGASQPLRADQLPRDRSRLSSCTIPASRRCRLASPSGGRTLDGESGKTWRAGQYGTVPPPNDRPIEVWTPLLAPRRSVSIPH